MVDVVGERSTWEWMILPLKRYADFSGRSRRKEYWLWVLFQIIVLVVLVVLAILLFGGLSGGGASDDLVGGLGLGAVSLLGLFFLALFIPNLAVQVRRMHDQDKTGWLVLLGFIPYIGGVIMFVFMLLEGTRGPNQYGPDPKGQSAVDPSIFA